jgi:hypothetical protein
MKKRLGFVGSHEWDGVSRKERFGEKLYFGTKRLSA